jgi:hypothetical protein
MARRRNPDPTADRNLIPGVLKGLRRTIGPGVEMVRASWAEIVGPGTASRTRVTGLEAGILRVEVASAALKHDLVAFRRGDVLAALRTRLPELRIDRVIYQVGAVS